MAHREALALSRRHLHPTFGKLSDFVTFAFVPIWNGADGFTVLEKGASQARGCRGNPRTLPSCPTKGLSPAHREHRESRLHGKYCWPLCYQQSADEDRGKHGWKDILPGVRVDLVDFLRSEGCAAPGSLSAETMLGGNRQQGPSPPRGLCV